MFIFKRIYYSINSIIALYLMRNVLTMLGAIFFIITLIIFSNQIVIIIKESLRYGIATADFLPMIGFGMVKNIPLILSLSLFFAIIAVFGKLYKGSEAIAMHSLGVSDKHFMAYIQPVVLLVFVLILILTTVVVPWSKEQKSTIISSSKISWFTLIKTKEFQKFKGGDIVFYASKAEDSVNGKEQIMKEVFVYVLFDDEPFIIMAKTAQKYTDSKTNNIYLRLKNGVRYYGFISDNNQRILNFDQYDIEVVNAENKQNKANTHVESKNTIDLFYSDNFKYIAELQWRLSQPLVVLILSFFGVLLGKTSPRNGKNMGLFFGIAIFVLYVYTLLFAKSILERGEVSALVGLWWVHILMLFVVLLLYAYQHKKFSMIRKLLPSI